MLSLPKPYIKTAYSFKAKMHQIRFQLGLRPRPRWGAYSASQIQVPLAGFKGAASRQEAEGEGIGKGGKEWGGRGRGGEEGR